MPAFSRVHTFTQFPLFDWLTMPLALPYQCRPFLALYEQGILNNGYFICHLSTILSPATNLLCPVFFLLAIVCFPYFTEFSELMSFIQSCDEKGPVFPWLDVIVLELREWMLTQTIICQVKIQTTAKKNFRIKGMPGPQFTVLLLQSESAPN